MQTTPPGPMNPAVLVVAVLVIVAVAISFGNRKQQRVLWTAFAFAVAMLLYPPWLGEKLEWINPAQQDAGQQASDYVHIPVSKGYAPLWSPPKREYSDTFRPFTIHWSRLLMQLGGLALAIGWLVVAFRHRPTRREPDDATASAETTLDSVEQQPKD